MPVDPRSPGTYITQVPADASQDIAGVATSITAFIGRAPCGPTDKAMPCSTFEEFQRVYGGLAVDFPMTYCVSDFFENGGSQVVIVRVGSGDDVLTALPLLDKVEAFNILCIPPDTRDGDTPLSAYQHAADYCQERQAFLIIDPPTQWSEDAKLGKFEDLDPTTLGINSATMRERNCAVYFPRVIKEDPLKNGARSVFPACGLIAGVMARTDQTRGVWAAPAGAEAGLNGAVDLEVDLSDHQNELLNSVGINALRNFPPVIGPLVWGARTLRGADALNDDYKYISVRRLAIYIEESVRKGVAFATFEPNDETVWSKLRTLIGNFMADLAKQGAVCEYHVSCDLTTMTPADVLDGRVNVVIMFAPMKPGEDIVLTFQFIAPTCP